MGLTDVKFVLDTNAALYFLGGRLEHPLPEGNYVVSVITELELLAYPDISPEEEVEIRSFLNDVQIEGLTDSIKSSAIDLRRRFRLRLPDAIIAATALSKDIERQPGHIRTHHRQCDFIDTSGRFQLRRGRQRPIRSTQRNTRTLMQCRRRRCDPIIVSGRRQQSHTPGTTVATFSERHHDIAQIQQIDVMV
jgi:predicted nucleic acid-binding protein